MTAPQLPNPAQAAEKRIVILGAGFGGMYTALRLEKLLARRNSGPPISVTLVARENYFLMTPLLFEACSGVLEARHAVSPLRAMFKTTQFIEAEVTGIDFEQRVVNGVHRPEGPKCDFPYDHLVIALGGVTNLQIIPGSEHALTFKTLAEAIVLRNRIIDLFERAEVETDPAGQQELLTFVIIGAGLVGVELMGELTEFIQQLSKAYRKVDFARVRFHLIEAQGKVLPEMDADLGAYAARVLERRGVKVSLNTPVKRIEPAAVHLPDGSIIRTRTIILAAGVTANDLVARLPLERGRHNRLVVDATMRSKERPEVWALGDCALIPDPQGKPYPPLAQHALREAKVLAGNLVAALDAAPALRPFVYQSMGTLASLGHYSGVGRVTKIKIRGFLAWWVWRTYYVMQMPRWPRRVRVITDWTIALFFTHDIVKLDLFAIHQLEKKKGEAESETINDKR